MKRVYALEEYCVGCRLCEINCIVAHSQSKDIIWAFKVEEPRPLPGILVEEARPISFGLQCRHCDDAVCIKSCITGAMHRDERDTVVCDTDKCVGCWTCIMACPYGAIKANENDGKVVSKCDLCPDLSQPACVSHCPNEALIYVDRG
ncbi:MAG: anaerobic carbon-monoxide dehydrogenase iron sulfur subunit [Clostridiales bacterium]|jgi:carbon-monoxide dehydrogenase iron sulfur subunit|nr:anaerobic carbon-monoxide dehydrogenase iron sulfur subunit [Clostridiales bacterium]MDK2991119.1 anaerobic carbon-monoxide dehydrogenase iron sulfur subunit [Clostridiales bacterium]